MSGDPVVLASVMLPARYGGFLGFLFDRLTVAYLEIQMEVELAVSSSEKAVSRKSELSQARSSQSSQVVLWAWLSMGRQSITSLVMSRTESSPSPITSHSRGALCHSLSLG